ncbi:MAG TPA: response regulator [Gemmatimonadales bacterium]|jgi:DNA-binding response OmpR family regulator|nr:response regulator [Gemmatimonadales bacterium]
MAEASDRPRVLVVDDDPSLARLIQHLPAIQAFGPSTHVTTGREALQALDGIDIVLLDHELPDASGLEILDAIRARPTPPAVVMITAHGTESLAATALRRGADDYLAKDPSLAELLPQVMERVRRGRELRKALGAAERDLVRAERLGAVGEMTVTLNHSINNPLMTAFADVEVLADPAVPEEQRRQALDSVREALRRIRDIVRQIGDLRALRSKTYAPGVQMVDLDQDAPAAHPPRRGAALMHVPEEDLARVVALLLRHAGFSVERVAGMEDLQRAAGAIGVALVVLIGGSSAAGAHPLGGFAPDGNRAYRVVALVAGDGEAARAGGADVVVQLPFDPGSFTADMITLVS